MKLSTNWRFRSGVVSCARDARRQPLHLATKILGGEPLPGVGGDHLTAGRRFRVGCRARRRVPYGTCCGEASVTIETEIQFRTGADSSPIVR